MSDLIFPVGFDGKVLFGVPTGTDHFLRFPFMKPFMNRNSKFFGFSEFFRFLPHFFLFFQIFISLSVYLIAFSINDHIPP